MCILLERHYTVANNMCYGMQCHSNTEQITDNGMKCRHSLIKGDKHIETGASQPCHQSATGDENNKCGIDIDKRRSAAGNCSRKTNKQGVLIIGCEFPPGRRSLEEEEKDVDKHVDKHEGVGKAFMLEQWLDTGEMALDGIRRRGRIGRGTGGGYGHCGGDGGGGGEGGVGVGVAKVVGGGWWGGVLNLGRIQDSRCLFCISTVFRAVFWC